MKFNKENLEKRLDKFFNRHPRLKRIFINLIKYYFPENKEKLKKIYFYNTVTFLVTSYIYYLIYHNISQDYVTISTLQYSIYNTLPTLYIKVNVFREIIKRIIPYV